MKIQTRLPVDNKLKNKITSKQIVGTFGESISRDEHYINIRIKDKKFKAKLKKYNRKIDKLIRKLEIVFNIETNFYTKMDIIYDSDKNMFKINLILIDRIIKDCKEIDNYILKESKFIVSIVEFKIFYKFFKHKILIELKKRINSKLDNLLLSTTKENENSVLIMLDKLIDC